MKHALALLAMCLMFNAPQTQSAPTDSRNIVRRDNAALIVAARRYPDTLRAALTEVMSRAATASNRVVFDSLTATARRLASSYAQAWSDSFLVRQVERFVARPAAQRTIKVRLDSLRREGGKVLGKAGTNAAAALFSESLRLARSIGDSTGQAAALGNIGSMLYSDGLLDSAEVLLRNSVTLARVTGDHRVRGNALGVLAAIERDRGNPARARSGFAQALALRELTGDDRGAASDENNLGLIAQDEGDLPQASAMFERALRRNRAAGRNSVAATNLGNLAGVAVISGDYARARALYDTALVIHRGLGERAWMAGVLHNIALLQMRRADFAGATTILEEAAVILDETGPALEAVLARIVLTGAYGAMGELQPAQTALRRAEQSARESRLPEALAHVALARAELALTFGAIPEAGKDFSAAAELFATMGDSGAQADALQGLATVELHRGAWAAAETALRKCLDLRLKFGDDHAAATTRLLLAHAATEQRNYASASEQLSQAGTALRAAGDLVGQATVLGLRADLELARGLPGAAVAGYRNALALLPVNGFPFVAMHLLSGSAAALESTGNSTGARSELRKATAILERTALPLRAAGKRAALRAGRTDIYESLAGLEFRTGNVEQAFQVSERMRAREILESLAAGRIASLQSSDSNLVAREQDLRQRIAALEGDTDYSALSLPRTGADALLMRHDVVRAVELESAYDAYSELMVRMWDETPRAAALVQPQMPTVKEIGALLRADEALIEYLVTDSTTLVFVVRRDGVKALDLRVERRSLAAAVDFVRELLTEREAPGGDSPWRPALRRLHRLLIEPLESAGLLGGVREIVMVPHAELHYLPFAALIRAGTTDKFLIEQYDLRYVPSAAVWTQLNRASAPRPHRGVLALAPLPGLFPASRSEALHVAATVGATPRALMGKGASERALRDSAANFAIIHLATLAVLNRRNPLFSHIKLAPSDGDDGLLNVHEIFGLRLAARLVTLSACETALGSGTSTDVPPGDDWIGLSRAFLHAGAENVMATLWPIEDRATEMVMHDFYGRLAPAATLSASLAASQRNALKRPETAHPRHWAAFALVGTGR